jgi:hypothetical protein
MSDRTLHSRRLNRVSSARYLAELLGRPVSPNTLRMWDIRRRQVGRDSVYEVPDLDAFAEARLAAAPERGAGAPAINEHRRRAGAGFKKANTAAVRTIIAKEK